MDRDWDAALRAVVDRLEVERGIDPPARVVTDRYATWIEYDGARWRSTELADEAELFEQIDWWVAFDRRAGPGRVLPRDEEAIQRWRDELPASQAVWESAAARVFADIRSATDLTWTWRLAVHEHTNEWAAAQGLPLPQEPLRHPELWITSDTWASVLGLVDDVDAAATELADRVQDDVIHEVWGAWPPCPGHPHPAEPRDGAWCCPATGAAFARIGELGT